MDGGGEGGDMIRSRVSNVLCVFHNDDLSKKAEMMGIDSSEGIELNKVEGGNSEELEEKGCAGGESVESDLLLERGEELGEEGRRDVVVYRGRKGNTTSLSPSHLVVSELPPRGPYVPVTATDPAEDDDEAGNNVE